MPRSRTPRVLGASALGLALAAVPALPAFAADGSGPAVTKDGSTYTIKVLETDNGEGDTFTPKGGTPTKQQPTGAPSVGDAYSFAAVLTQDGTKVGTDGGTCTVQSVDLEAKAAINLCRVTLKFANGTITVQDNVTFSDQQSTFKVAIVDGTGAYDGIKGTLTVHDLNSSSNSESNAPSLSDLTLTYTLPAAAVAGPAATKDGDSTSIAVLEHPTGQKFIPKGGSEQDFPKDNKNFAPKVGDGVHFMSDFSQDGTKVGSLDGHCVFKNVDTHVDHCKATATFANGTLVVEDDTTEGNDFSLAIIGGTGAYEGATGHVHVVSVSKNSDDSNDTFTFTTGGSQVSEKPAGGAATGGGFSDSSNSALVIGLGLLAGVGGLGVFAGGRVLARKD